MSPPGAFAAPANGSSAAEREVVVVGGGVAGLSAAWSLAGAGARVTVLEAGAVLGGRAATLGRIELRHGGEAFAFPIEHGIHGVWRPYLNLKRLLDEVGASARLVPMEEQELWCPNGGGSLLCARVGSVLRRSRLPEPLSFLGFLAVPAIARDALRLRAWPYLRAGRDLGHLLAYAPGLDAAEYDAFSARDLIGAWPPLLRRLFTALARSGFFAEPEDISLAAFLEALRYYVADDRENTAFAVLDDAPEGVLFAPLAERVRAAGGEVRLGARVESLVVRDGRCAGVRVAEAGARYELAARATVLAVDASAMRRLAAASSLTPPEGLPGTVPSATVRLWFSSAPGDRAATSGIAEDAPFNAFFWLHRLQGPFARFHARSGGAVLEAHLYGANAAQAQARSDGEVSAEAEGAAARMWPELRGRVLLRHVVRNAATHTSFAPGTYARSAPPRGFFPSVALCGDWVALPWHAMNLERACATGLLAAEEVAPGLALDPARLVPALRPLPATPASRWTRFLFRAARRAGALPSLPRPPSRGAVRPTRHHL